MFAFTKVIWGLLRPENGSGRKLRWTWAALALAFFGLCYGAAYCVVAPVRLLAGWLARWERCPDWLRGSGASTRDWLWSVFFSVPGKPAPGETNPSGHSWELFSVAGCVEPVRFGGPYPDDAALVNAARRARQMYGAEDVLLAARVDDHGRTELSSFTVEELDGADERMSA